MCVCVCVCVHMCVSPCEALCVCECVRVCVHGFGTKRQDCDLQGSPLMQNFEAKSHISNNVKTEGLASSAPSPDPLLIMKKTALPEVLAWLPDTHLQSLVPSLKGKRQAGASPFGAAGLSRSGVADAALSTATLPAP